MNLYRAFIYLSILLSAGCVRTASIPPADLTLSSVETGPKNLLIINFSSTVDLANAFNAYENANQLTPTLTCSLDGDMNFSPEHSISMRAEGLVATDSEFKSNFGFYSELVFYNTRADGTQHDLNDYEAIRPRLANQSSIPCKVRITAYGYKAYYTNTLFVPTKQITEQIYR
ncbi:hypothetical protein [Pseudomonas sp. McL0111]|uniref:hypothetical protein n=1 Tax=Pseudomonas sp. McL0111 TaxID=3457357 RepID=UPI00403E75C4